MLLFPLLLVTAHPRSHRAAAWICGRWLSRMWASLRGSGWEFSALSDGPGDGQSTADPADGAGGTSSSARPVSSPAVSQQPAGPSRRAGLHTEVKGEDTSAFKNVTDHWETLTMAYLVSGWLWWWGEPVLPAPCGVPQCFCKSWTWVWWIPLKYLQKS